MLFHAMQSTAKPYKLQAIDWRNWRTWREMPVNMRSNKRLRIFCDPPATRVNATRYAMQGGRGSAHVRANLYIIITPPTKFFAICFWCACGSRVYYMLYLVNTPQSSRNFSCFALESGLCGYRDILIALSMASNGMRYQVGNFST